MKDLKNMGIEDFITIETSRKASIGNKTFASFFRVKPGSNVAPVKQIMISPLPQECYEQLQKGL